MSVCRYTIVSAFVLVVVAICVRFEMIAPDLGALLVIALPAVAIGSKLKPAPGPCRPQEWAL